MDTGFNSTQLKFRPLYHPAGQAAPATTAPAATTPTTPAAPASPAVQFTSDGRIAGIDGVLNQIAEAVSRQVVPIVRDTALPILQRDKELQRTIGDAAGRGAVKQLRPFLWIIAGSIALIAYTYWRKNEPVRSNPTRRVRRRRRS